MDSMSNSVKPGIQSVCVRGAMRRNLGKAVWDPNEAGRIEFGLISLLAGVAVEGIPTLNVGVGGVSYFCSVPKEMACTVPKTG